MENEYVPTKTNLIKIQNTLKLSKQGLSLLDKKKNVLIRELEKYKQQVNELENNAIQLFKDGYILLQNANVDIGIENMIKIADGIQEEKQIDIKYKTIMGVEIPSIIYNTQENKLNYGFNITTISVDKAVIKFNEIKEIIIKLAQIENIVYRLKKSIDKVQKRSNALKDVIIPKNEEIEKHINNSIEEKEREEFVRLKIIKKKRR